MGATVNGLFAAGSEDALGDSGRLFWHLHADGYLDQFLSPVVEFNGYHTLSDGDNAALPSSGVDVANLGGGEGEDVVTGALGLELRPGAGIGVRAAYGSPLTDNEDLYGYRRTASLVCGFRPAEDSRGGGATSRLRRRSPGCDPRIPDPTSENPP